MPKLNHQAEELTRAISQTIDIEATKARLDVITIIQDGLEQGKLPMAILADLTDWAGK